MSIKEHLYNWRDNKAKERGIENFRILPNSTLDDIANVKPKNKEELCSIKGIKEMKFSQYGEEILKIITGDLTEFNLSKQNQTDNEILTVSQYLNLLNSKLRLTSAKIIGEVVSFQARGNAIYFNIKDKNDDSVISVFMWLSDYNISGINLAIGDEIIIHGYSEIYKPTGKLSLRALIIELIGEGALKKAYDDLKIKLDKQGIFSVDKKRKLKDFPKKIGVITSKQGAVIHDFLNNLSKRGYVINFIDSRVEGALAISDLLKSINVMSKTDIDVLVIIRGGGSLESLQAFNNENVVMAISNFKTPVICAIGHDKDIPLSQLAADYAPSTPSICSTILNESWSNAEFEVNFLNKRIFSSFELVVSGINQRVSSKHFELNLEYNNLKTYSKDIIDGFNVVLVNFSNILEFSKFNIDKVKIYFIEKIYTLQKRFKENIVQLNDVIMAHDPLNRLKIGYSILYLSGRVLKSVNKVKVGDNISAKVADGEIIANVTNYKKYD